jgi:hypothetical protein
MIDNGELIKPKPLGGLAMRGNIISAEYNKLVFVRDNNGGEYACNARDLSDQNHVKEDEKKNCIDTNLVLGASW